MSLPSYHVACPECHGSGQLRDGLCDSCESTGNARCAARDRWTGTRQIRCRQDAAVLARIDRPKSQPFPACLDCVTDFNLIALEEFDVIAA